MPHCWKSHVTAHFYFLFVSVSQKLDSPNQTAEYLGKQNQIVWKINKLPGKTETVAQFRVGLLNYGYVYSIMCMFAQLWECLLTYGYVCSIMGMFAHLWVLFAQFRVCLLQPRNYQFSNILQ